MDIVHIEFDLEIDNWSEVEALKDHINDWQAEMLHPTVSHWEVIEENDLHNEKITVWDVWIPFMDEWLRQVKENAERYRVEAYSRDTSAGQGYAVVSGLYCNVVAFMRFAYDDGWTFGALR